MIYIDHDHDCCKPRDGHSFSCGYCRRGLACRSCNTGIALFGEDPQLLRLVADNLERAQVITKAVVRTKPEQGDLLGTVTEALPLPACDDARMSLPRRLPLPS